jgi:predicted nuclease with TOPRIM domain
MPNWSRIDSEDDNDEFLGNEREQQQMQLNRQDQNLDALHSAVSRLGEMGMTINDELDDQNRMIDELGTDMDKAGNNLEMITAKTKELVKASGGCKMFCALVWLTMILLFLIVLVIYT